MDSENETRNVPCCFDCRFWRSTRLGNEIGECKRYPPVLSMPALVALMAKYDDKDAPETEKAFESAATQFAWEYPHTEHCDWCGEFQSKRLM